MKNAKSKSEEVQVPNRQMNMNRSFKERGIQIVNAWKNLHFTSHLRNAKVTLNYQ